MDKQRQGAYLSLIELLLNSPSAKVGKCGNALRQDIPDIVIEDWKDFVEVVAAASVQTQLRIMGLLLDLLPQALQDEISNAVDIAIVCSVKAGNKEALADLPDVRDYSHLA